MASHSISQIEQVVAALRARILCGEFKPGERLMEVPIANELSVSRTPVRLALGWLEREGLVHTAGPKRGFVVRAFAVEDVFDSIEMRGCLEGIAARLATERGVSAKQRERLLASLSFGDALVGVPVSSIESQQAWVQNNVEFHQAILDSAGSQVIAEQIERLNNMPLVSPAAISFAVQDLDGDIARFRRVQDDHRSIVDAILNNQGLRAEMLVREHAYRNITNKKRNFTAIKEFETSNSLPGIDLVHPS